MIHEETAPHPLLRDAVKCYWLHEELHTDQTEAHLFLPDSYVELGVYLGDSMLSGWDGRSRTLPTVYLTGIRRVPANFVSSGLTKLVGVRFYTWGAKRLLGLEGDPDGLGVGRYPALRELSYILAPMLERSAYTAAFAALDEWLLERHRQSALEPDAIEAAGHDLYASNGGLTVAQLADRRELSVRQFERRFKQSAGLAPKSLARLIRFERAHDHLILEPGACLTDLAYDLGYADQAHFAREFRAFAHRSPSQFASLVRNSWWWGDMAVHGEPAPETPVLAASRDVLEFARAS